MLYLVFFCLLILRNVHAAFDYTTTHTGHITFYGAGSDSGGTCSYNNPKHSLGIPTVAIGNFGLAEKCGTCVQITPLGTGTGATTSFKTRGTFIAYVNNQCPECGEDHLDLCETGDGIWEISWKFVECPVSGNMQLQLKTGSSKYHTEISARNFKNAIKSIEYNISNSWVALERRSYNYFVYGSQIEPPIAVRLTSFLGNKQTMTLTAADYSNIEPGLISTSLQFPASGSNPVTPPTAPVKPPSTPPTAPVKPPSTPPTAPVKPPSTPPTAPVKPPSTPTKPPSTPPATPTKPGPTCEYRTANDWWIEVWTGQTTETIYVKCSDNSVKVDCEYDPSLVKYKCPVKGSTSCTVPRRAYINGACCSLDANSCSSGTAILEEDSSVSNNGSLSTGALIGVVVAAIVVVGLVIGFITYRLLKKPIEEHV